MPCTAAAAVAFLRPGADGRLVDGGDVEGFVVARGFAAACVVLAAW